LVGRTAAAGGGARSRVQIAPAQVLDRRKSIGDLKTETPAEREGTAGVR
jgi:hypothetical protein